VTTFAALGDSITLGIGDPVRMGADGRAWRGWAVLLADALVEPDLHILAASGARVADIERDQLPRALALRPDIASVVFGINDTLRPGFDPGLIESAAAHTVGALCAAGAQVLSMRLPDADRMLGLPGAFARPLAARTQQVNAVLDAIASRFGTLHFDAAGTPEAYDRRMWAADRLHPNERGHRLIARSFHGLLAAAGDPLGPPPCAEPSSPAPTRLAVLAWLATRGTSWVLRRSTDLVPHLLAMAARDVLGSVAWHRGPGPGRPAGHLRAGVLGEPGEQAAQAGDLFLADAAPQSLVEGRRGVAEPAEHLLAGLRELDDVDAAVRRIALPGDQASDLHGVEVMGQRRLPDSYRLG